MAEDRFWKETLPSGNVLIQDREKKDSVCLIWVKQYPKVVDIILDALNKKNPKEV